MNKYVIAYLSLFDGEILQEVVEANSKLEAAASYLNHDEVYDTFEELQSAIFDQDGFINVLDLNECKRYTTGQGSLNEFRTSANAETKRVATIKQKH